MKKIFVCLLALSLAFTLVSCNSSKTETAEMEADSDVISDQSTDTAAPDYSALVASVLNYHPGVAGSSLAKAVAAKALLEFAVANNLFQEDADEVKSLLDSAVAGLSDDEKANYKSVISDNSEDGIIRLVDNSLVDYDAVRAQFDDAGAGGMYGYVYSVRAGDSWEVLKTVLEVSAENIK
ncbi:MAG: hypothetical protein K6F64_03065 [Clostridia bacterium]|nr:hypothetical protein [Clostridia bacterium]